MDVNLKIFFLFSFPFVSRQTNHAKITHRKRKKSEQMNTESRNRNWKVRENDKAQCRRRNAPQDRWDRKLWGGWRKTWRGAFYSRRDSSTTTSEHGHEFRFQFFFGFLETTGHSFFDTCLLAVGEIYMFFFRFDAPWDVDFYGHSWKGLFKGKLRIFNFHFNINS